MSTAETLLRFITDELLVQSSDRRITADDNLLAAGIVNSLGFMRLVGFIEEEFGIDVPPEDVTIENFRSIAHVAAYLEKELGVR